VGAVALVLAVLAVLSRGPVAILRAIALALVLLALANPALVQEEREKVKDIVAVVIDRSTSQTLGDRPTWSHDSSKPMMATAMTEHACSQPSPTDLPTFRPIAWPASSSSRTGSCMIFRHLSTALASRRLSMR
jgi:hypothetical protein